MWLDGSGFLVVPVKPVEVHALRACEVTYVTRVRVADDRIDEWMFRWKTLIHERTTALFELKTMCEAQADDAAAAARASEPAAETQRAPFDHAARAP